MVNVFSSSVLTDEGVNFREGSDVLIFGSCSDVFSTCALHEFPESIILFSYNYNRYSITR